MRGTIDIEAESRSSTEGAGTDERSDDHVVIVENQSSVAVAPGYDRIWYLPFFEENGNDAEAPA